MTGQNWQNKRQWWKANLLAKGLLEVPIQTLIATTMGENSFPQYVYKRVTDLCYKKMALREGIIQYAPLADYQRAEYSDARQDKDEGQVRILPYCAWLPSSFVSVLQEGGKKTIPILGKLLDYNDIEMVRVDISEIPWYSAFPLAPVVFCCSVEKDLPEKIKRDFGEFVYKIDVEAFLRNCVGVVPYKCNPDCFCLSDNQHIPVQKTTPIIGRGEVRYVQSIIPESAMDKCIPLILSLIAQGLLTFSRGEEMVASLKRFNRGIDIISDSDINPDAASFLKYLSDMHRVPAISFVKRESFSEQKEFRFTISFLRHDALVMARSVEMSADKKPLWRDPDIRGQLAPPQKPFLVKVNNHREVFSDV